MDTNLLEQIAGKAVPAGLHAAYGDPIDIGGSTIVPVAIVMYGFGGGSGGEVAKDAEGGGGGGSLFPIGAYVSGSGDKATFRPNTLTIAVAAIPVILAVGCTLRGIIRSLKKH